VLSGRIFSDIFEGVNLSDEALFQSASDALFKLISDSEKNNKEKLIYILELGLAYYGLDTAVVSSITGNSYVVNEVVSSVTVPFDQRKATSVYPSFTVLLSKSRIMRFTRMGRTSYQYLATSVQR